MKVTRTLRVSENPPKSIARWVLWLALFSGCNVPAVAQPQIGALAIRARQFAAAVNSHEPRKYLRFIAESGSPQMRAFPPAAHIRVISSYWDMSRGLEFVRITPLGPYAGRVVYRNHLTGGYSSIFLRVDAAPPHRILALSPLTDMHYTFPGAPAPTIDPHRLTDKQIVARLDAFMNRLSRAEVFSGVVVLARDGAPVFQHAYGEADRAEGVPNRLDTEFQMASMGKMFTAVAIAQQVERGRPPEAGMRQRTIS